MNKLNVFPRRRDLYYRPARKTSTWPTITSCPNSLRRRLTLSECIPVSSAMQLRGVAANLAVSALGVVATLSSRTIFPPSSSTHSNWSGRQIQTDRQFLLGKIPDLLPRGGANLLNCRSPFISCASKQVDNLGAYSIPFGDPPSPSKTAVGRSALNSLHPL
jgi:hypothetical protein